MPDWQIRIELDGEERDIAKAMAQGMANMLGLKVALLREMPDEHVYVDSFEPVPRS